jgi:chorismate mutase/prephenate dehydratase
MIDVSYMGMPGSHTEVAAIEYFGTDSVNLIPSRYPSDVFGNLDSGAAQYGILPIYNSTEGLVTKTCDLLFNTPHAKIVNEHISSIENSLFAIDGATLLGIRTIISHPQPLEQCSITLEEMGADLIPFSSTSAAAERVAKEGRLDQAAIASSRAGTLHNLKLLRADMANTKFNYTRFIIIANQTIIQPQADRTAITFVLNQGVGALEHALHCFSANKIEHMFITSRPLADPKKPDDAWKNYFYMVCAASSRASSMQKALNSLERHAKDIRVHGSYVKAAMPKLKN